MDDHRRYMAGWFRATGAVRLGRRTYEISATCPPRCARSSTRTGGPILVVGSSVLAQTLMTAGVVDRYALRPHPVVLGAGRRLFRDGAPARTLRLEASRTTADGLVILDYGCSHEHPRA
jgi:dihydrofolate reductase